MSLEKYFEGNEIGASVWKSKYAAEGETTPDDTHARIAKEFARIHMNYPLDSPYPLGTTQEEVYKSIFNLFKDFKYVIPAGSVLASLGLGRPESLSNCFVHGQPTDSIEGIFNQMRDQAQLMKRRGGVGNDLSTIRPKGMAVNNAAKTSTGVQSWMPVYSEVTKTIAQNGRRGALMLSISITHPDSEDFATSKQDTSKITGANISVKISDEFMYAVVTDSEYIQRWPITTDVPEDISIELKVGESKVVGNRMFKKIRARELWDTIITCAHNTAEPGILFENTHHQYSPDGVYSKYRGVTTNPCFAGNMKLLTSTGFKTFESLVEQGETRIINTVGKRTKAEIHYSGEKEIYRVIFHGLDREIECTQDHIFESVDGEIKPIIELIGKKLKFPLHSNTRMDEFTALGFLFAIGNVLNRNGNDGLVAKVSKVDAKMLKLFNFEVPENGSKSLFFRNEYDKLNSLNLIEKRVLSEEFNTLTLAAKTSFLKGIFSTHLCTIEEDGIKLRSRNNDFINSVRDFLKETFDIRSYKTVKDITDHLGNRVMEHSMVIADFNSIVAFKTLIGFARTKTANAVNTLLLRRNKKIKAVTFDRVGKVYDFGVFSPNPWGYVEGYKSHNCGEIFMQPGDSCRLIHMNLLSYVENPFTDKAYFNYIKFEEHAFQTSLLADDMVDLEIEALDRIMDKIWDEDGETDEYELWNTIRKSAKEGRRCGIGFTGLSDTVAALGYKLGSDAGLSIIESIMRTKASAELEAQIYMAQSRGTFSGWDPNVEFELGPREDQSQTLRGKNLYFNRLCNEFPSLALGLYANGRRNVSWSTVAPTGTTSLVAGNISSGIEPVFAIVFWRNKKAVDGDRIDYYDVDGIPYTTYPVVHPTFKKWYQINSTPSAKSIESMTKQEIEDLISLSPYADSCSHDLNWEKRIEIQDIVQRYTTHSISSTCNLHKDVTVQEVSDLYLSAWKTGLKGITVYRDGSREGILNLDSKAKPKGTEVVDVEEFSRRPIVLPAKVVRFNNNGTPWVAFLGLKDGLPFEIFTGPVDLEALPIQKGVETGKIIKALTEQGSRYDFQYVDKYGYTNTVGGLSQTFDKEYWNYARLISGFLRQRVPIENVINIIDGMVMEKESLNNWKNGVIRSLKGFIVDGTSVGKQCSECGTELRYEGGCTICPNCGNSKCG